MIVLVVTVNCEHQDCSRSTDYWWNDGVTSYMLCKCIEIIICSTFLQLCVFVFADMEVSESDEEHLTHMDM